MAPDYENLTLLQKVEVFEYALENTTGQDLYRVLWLKSTHTPGGINVNDIDYVKYYNTVENILLTTTGQGAPWPVRRRDAGEGRASKGDGESER